MEHADVVLVDGCSLHDAGNAVKWSILPMTDDLDKTLKMLHISIASVKKNSFDLLSSVTPEIAQNIKLVGRVRPDAGGRAIWTALGQDEATTDRLVKTGLWFDGKDLAAHESIQLIPNWQEEMGVLMMKVFRYRTFNAARFGSLIGFSKLVLGSILAGH